MVPLATQSSGLVGKNDSHAQSGLKEVEVEDEERAEEAEEGEDGEVGDDGEGSVAAASTTMPVSSATSRLAQASRLSPSSRPPPCRGAVWTIAPGPQLTWSGHRVEEWRWSMKSCELL